MRIAIVHDFLFQYGGAERVLEVIYELYPGSTIFTLGYDYKAFPLNWKNYSVVSLSDSLLFSQRFPQLYAQYYCYLLSTIDFSTFDIVISSDTLFSKFLCIPNSTKHIIYQYSPADMLYHFLPFSQRSVFARLTMSLQKKYLRYEDFMSVRRADIYLTLSDYVSNRALSLYGIKPNVLYPPVKLPSIVERTCLLNTHYFVLIARLVPEKMIEHVILAFRHSDYSLVIIGDGRDRKRLESLSSSNIRFVGNVSDTIKYNYLTYACGTIVSSEEDFGLVAVESLACGTPVVAYGRGGASETVIHGITGYCYENQTDTSLSEAISAFLNISFNKNICIQSAQKFSDDIFVAKFRTLIDELVLSM